MNNNVTPLEAHDPRTGPWHVAYVICSQCLYSAAAVWPDSKLIVCPRCEDERVGAWKDPPSVEVAMHALRKLRDAKREQCPHCAEDISDVLFEDGWYEITDGGPPAAPGGFVQEAWSEGTQTCNSCGLKHSRGD